MSNTFLLERLEIGENEIISQNEITFKKGLNIILGNNATGKTTLLDIINFLITPKKREYYSKFAPVTFKYYLNSKFLGFNEEEPIIIEAKGNIINLLSFSENVGKDNIIKVLSRIKVIYFNRRTINNYLKKREYPETLSPDQLYSHILLDKTENLENYLILIDDINAVFGIETNYLFLNYLSELSEKNQVILTSLPNVFKKILNYLKEIDIDSQLLNYLRQSQILFLRELWQRSIFDYFKEEQILDFSRRFRESIKNIQIIINLPVDVKDIKENLYRIMYANVITVIETFLSDSFTKIVIKNENFKLKLLDSIPELSQKKLNLRDAYDWIENMDDNITEVLQTISFHNLGKVKGMFENVLGINFPDDMGYIYKAIIIRHDIIHRNGKNKKGEIIKITREIIQELIEVVDKFIKYIESQISNLQINFY